MRITLHNDIDGIGGKGESVDVSDNRGAALVAAGQAHAAGATVPTYPQDAILLENGQAVIVAADGTRTTYTSATLLAALVAAATVPGLTNTVSALSTYTDLLASALDGDMVLVITPATVDLAETAAGWTRQVTITLETAAGAVHTWYNADLSVAIGDTSALGEATITDATPPMVAGTCTVEITGDAVQWAAGEADTLTIANQTILGFTVTGGTSVQTIIV